MKVTVKITKRLKDNDICPFQEVGIVTLEQRDLEAIALQMFRISEKTGDKFEYNASMNLIEVE